MEATVKLQELEFRVHQLESLLTRQAESPVSSNEENDPQLLDVIQMTNEIFPGEITVGIEADPDEPETRFIVFNVESTEDVKAIVAKQREWNRIVSTIPIGRTGRLRISVIPV